MRVQLPNRPGALGAVATALGAIGADINLVEILQKRGDIEIDEFILDLPSGQTVESLVATCDALDLVQVEWVRNYPRGGDIIYDVELHERMTADRRRAGEILVSAAPLVFRADWSVLLQLSPPRAAFCTPAAPNLDPSLIGRFQPFDTIHRIVLEPGWQEGWDGHHAVLAPISEQEAVIIGRRGEPSFFRSELTRLAYLVGGTSGTDSAGQPVTVTAPGLGHRRPVTAPIYTREHA
ncbi:MAG TPA: amino acid-binding protein [Microlunatus sp.]|nr:amino acid-binding protein [Microlunatus sp.]